jgi:hypothetical protein
MTSVRCSSFAFEQAVQREGFSKARLRSLDFLPFGCDSKAEGGCLHRSVTVARLTLPFGHVVRVAHFNDLCSLTHPCVKAVLRSGSQRLYLDAQGLASFQRFRSKLFELCCGLIKVSDSLVELGVICLLWVIRMHHALALG